MLSFKCGVIRHLFRRKLNMDAILGFVEELLTYLREFEAAGIIEIIRDFFTNLFPAA